MLVRPFVLVVWEQGQLRMVRHIIVAEYGFTRGGVEKVETVALPCRMSWAKIRRQADAQAKSAQVQDVCIEFPNLCPKKFNTWGF